MENFLPLSRWCKSAVDMPSLCKRTYSMLTRVEVPLTQWIKDFTEGRETGISVPCGECHACCTCLKPQLYPEELKKGYLKKFDKNLQKYYLRHKPNGHCVYLIPEGCSIHLRVPRVCKTFDCRFRGYFNIKDPKHEKIDAASQRWIFIVDNEEIHKYCYQYFQVAINLLPVKRGDPVDNAAKEAIYATYRHFFALEKPNENRIDQTK